MNHFGILILLCIAKSCIGLGIQDKLLSPVDDSKLNFVQLASKYGFPNAECRDVITEDGYILGVHHIPGDPQRPVLLAHGNTADSICWVLRGKISLAITLAKRGYDVWALNFRGTTLSRRHLCLDPDTQRAEFFNYTFYEQGAYDLPATIDFILNETNQTQLLAIGHSVGTTNFYVLGSEKPEYNEKIKVFISLAPISFLQHTRVLVTDVPIIGDTLLELLTDLGVNELCGQKQLIPAGFFNVTCFGEQGYKLCVEGIAFPLFGYDHQGFEPEFTRTFFGHYPDGTSRKLFQHLFQVIDRNKFARFDYGTKGNMLEYGTSEPPEFDLSKATMKMALFVGEEDFLASVPDAERLRCALPNVVHYQVMPYERFNHIDFVWGRYMPSNLYPYLLPVIEKYINC